MEMRESGTKGASEIDADSTRHLGTDRCFAVASRAAAVAGWACAFGAYAGNVGTQPG